MTNETTTWRKQLDSRCKRLGEDIEYVVFGKVESYHEYDGEPIDFEFDPGFGDTNGPHFQAWTKTYVLFPVRYDGAEWVGVAHRNPCDIPLEHEGG